ncbi:LysM peptidoglycan-binding domain-containing protein [Promicromonospora sp. NPDC057488]|uniref:LysM peptidoglycan-binding domain-containing protein n=1 Tax=Promicromonospora sp. NPDC057488 TaxID=3346147 RepID=UPI00366B6ACC
MQHPHRIAAAVAATILSTTAAGALLVATVLPAAAVPAYAGAGTAVTDTMTSGVTSGSTTGLATTLATGTKDGEKVKYYVVPAKPEGEQEFLFDIAQRFLGDGNRYSEIFELNKGRTQPDGDALMDETVLLPGWVLQMPADAEGEGLEVGVLPTGPAGGAGEASTPAEEPAAPSVPYYVIAETPEGEPEYLYMIAERFLGDGERNSEIFELNKGRTQPDGGKLTDPAVVTVGWVLQLPEDAKGEGLQNGPLPGPSASPEASAPAAGEGTEAAADDQAGDSGSWLSPVLIGVGLTVIAVALVLVVVYLVRRARSNRAEPFDDSLLRTDTSASWMVDRALRVLLAACERDGLDVPGVTGVFIEGGAMRLRLAEPVSPAPEPFVANEDGQSWSAPLARLQAAPASEASTARFSRLVTIGVAETGRVLVDFARARGVISLDGPTRARHEVLRRWLGELTGNPWSNDPRVVMVGNGLPQPEQVEHLTAIEQVIPELEIGAGGVLVLSQAPSVAQQDLLAARFSDPRFSWVVIVLGESTSAKWRITAAEDGWLRSGFLPDVRYTEQTAVRRAGE